MPESLTPEKALREHERKITCSVCREHYVDPKILSCGHSFCKRRCILLPDFRCPEPGCGQEVHVDDVDTLDDPPDVKEALLNFCHSEKVEVLKKAKCDSCSLMNDAVAYCENCIQLLCSTCVAAHQRMKVFSTHNRLSFEEMEGDIVERLLNKHARSESCPEHSRPRIAYCFECDQQACCECAVTRHRKHKLVFNRSASPRAKEELLSELERMEIIEDFISRVQEDQNLLGAPEDIWKEIQDSFQELHAIIESRQQELVDEATAIVKGKAENLSQQQSSLYDAMKSIDKLKRDTLHCAARVSDEDDADAHKGLLEKIEEASAEYSNPMKRFVPVDIDDFSVQIDLADTLLKLCNEEISVVFLELDPGKCIVEFDEKDPPKMDRKSKARLMVRLTNSRGARSPCDIECKITCSADGSSVPCDVEQIGGGVYHILFTPTVNKYHELTASVNGQPLSGSPFTFFVYVPPASQEKEVPVEQEFIPMQTFLEYNKEVAESEEFWTWEEHGLELLFKDDIHDEVPEKRVSITAEPDGEFILPKDTEPASVAFLVQCPFDLKNKVQVKIPHFASETTTEKYRLSFAVSRDLTPPFKFELVDGGKFNPGKGEMEVENFSWWTILYVRAAEYIESTLINWADHVYRIFLYRQRECEFFPPNEFSWNVHFFAVRDVVTFQNDVQKYAQSKLLKEVTSSALKFSENSSLKISKLPNENGWSMSCNRSLSKDLIDQYQAGMPPEWMFKLRLKYERGKVEHLRHEFEIDGVKQMYQSLHFDMPLPDIDLGARITSYDGGIPADLEDLLCNQNHIKKYRQALSKIPMINHCHLKKGLKEGHVPVIAEKLLDWQTKPHLFELSLSDVRTISEQFTTDPKLRRMEALATWRKKSADTSYERLLCVCINGEMKAGMDQIVEVMCKFKEVEEETTWPGPTPVPSRPSSSVSMRNIVLVTLTVTAVVAIAGFLYMKYKKK